MEEDNKKIKVPFFIPEFTEEMKNAAVNALQNEKFVMGESVYKFEEEFAKYTGTKLAVSVNSGNAALHLSLLALGINNKSSVITSTNSFIASTNCILMTGAKPILCDIKPEDGNIDISSTDEKADAIIPVHIYGNPCDFDSIRKVSEESKIPIIEDACQAFFSSNFNGYLGTQSDVGCFSLGVTKLVSTGQGGFVVTKNRDVYERLKCIRNHGVTDEFTESYDRFGFNFKFTDVLASFGLVQLSRVSKRIVHLNKIYAKYESAISKFKCVNLLPVNVLNGEIPLYAEVLCPERKELENFLHFHNIQARIVPPDLSLSSCLKDDGSFPNSIRFSDQGLYLPCGPEQLLENIDFVIDTLYDFKVAEMIMQSLDI